MKNRELVSELLKLDPELEVIYVDRVQGYTAIGTPFVDLIETKYESNYMIDLTGSTTLLDQEQRD